MKYFKCILLLILIFLSTIGFAQERCVDSLKKLLPLIHDSVKVKTLIQIGCWYGNMCSTGDTGTNRDSSLLYLNQAFNESVKIGYIEGTASVLFARSMDEMNRHHYPASERYLRQCVPYFEKVRDSKGIACTHILLGYLLYQQGRFDKAIQELQIGISLLQKFNTSEDRLGISQAFEILSVTYGLKGDLAKGFEIAQNELAKSQQRNDSLGMAFPLLIIGDLYESMGDHNIALEYYYSSAALGGNLDLYLALQMAAVHNAMHQYDSALYYYRSASQRDTANYSARVYLGEIYLNQKKYNEALQVFKKSTIFLKKNNGYNGLLRVLPDMAKLYVAWNNHQQALYYAREGLKLAQRTGARQYKAEDLKLLSEIYSSMGKSEMALSYLKQFMTLKDSLLNDQLKAKLFGYRSRVENEKKQAQIEWLKKEKQVSAQLLELQQQRLQQASLLRKILLTGILAFVFLGVIFFRNLTLKRRNEKLLSERTQTALQHKTVELEMQALRAQMNPHFIFNCLSSINGYILKSKSESASDYLIKFSRLIRMVLNSSKKTVIPLEDELEMLRLYLEMERLRFQYSFNYTIDVKNEIDIQNVFIPPLLLQPFAENAIWHGLMHKEGNGHLEIELGMEEEILTCIIADNGIGRHKAGVIKSKSAEKQKSMGLQITTERLALLSREKEAKTFFKIEDLSDEQGNPTGTRVILKVHCMDAIESIAELH
ncbi:MULTISPECIES: tetratricopeptide repeat-containing sensor histidine kinase [Niastella]|uniref:Tetratricopeptide repeat protein n=1 Tax=Niastella soli TaxID=2821487 RepID=A0ABS3YYM5_9BACT|nr:histidine kinase [Niastella soli]MBO9203032.1 tetratricopeptide repeat protein [Niastella soli]